MLTKTKNVQKDKKSKENLVNQFKGLKVID